MNETESQTKRLEGWFKELIEKFREEYEKLTPEEQRNILNDNDYSSPCQIEVFWISKPFEFQMIVITHDQRRNDKEVIINEPFEKSIFKSKLAEIMEEDRWKNIVPYEPEEVHFPDEINIGFQEQKYSDYLVNKFRGLYWYLDNPNFEHFPVFISTGEMLKERDYVLFIKGNIADFKDVDIFVKEIIKAAKNMDYSSNTFPSIINQPSAEKNTEIKYLGAYFYPLLRIGDNVELSFSQKLSVVMDEAIFEPKKEFEFTFCGNRIFCDTFGFLALEIDENELNRATKILNTIFATSVFYGHNCLSAKASELVTVKEMPNNQQIFVSSWQYSDTKRPLSHTYYGHRKNRISIDSMEQIIKSAEALFADEKLNDLMILFLESFSHHYNSEYSQSFLYSWFIIEKYISQLFDDLLADKKVTGDRKTKFTNQDKWSSDSRIEVLNLVGLLPAEKYRVISKYNKKRNKFVHRGEPISRDEAEELLNMSKEVLGIQIALNLHKQLVQKFYPLKLYF